MGRKIQRHSSLILFAIPFTIYLFTLCPTIYVRDAGLSVSGAVALGVIYPPGFPLYYIVGRLFALLPLGDVPFRINLMSAFFGALTVVTMGKAIEGFLETGDSNYKGENGSDSGRSISIRWIALFSALFLSLIPAFWSQCLIAEEYALNAFVFSLLFLFGLKALQSGSEGFFYLAAFFLGLALSNHPQAIFFIPSFIFILTINRRCRKYLISRLAYSSALVMVGLLCYLYIPVRAASDTPVVWEKIDTLEDFYRYFIARQYHEQMFSTTLLGYGYKLRMALKIVVEELSVPGIAMVALGMLSTFRRNWKTGMFLLMIPLIGIIVSSHIKFNRHTISVYLIPSIMALIFFGARGLLGIWDLWRGKIPELSKVTVMTFLMAIMGIANWNACNRNGCYINLSLGKDILNSLPHGASFLTEGDNPTFSILYLRTVEKERPDVQIVGKDGILFDRWRGDKGRPLFAFSPGDEREKRRPFGIIYTNGEGPSHHENKAMFDRYRLKEELKGWLPEDGEVRFVAALYHERLGGYLLGKGYLNEGLAALDRASSTGGLLNEAVHNNVGLHLRRGGYWTEAEREFSIAIQINPIYPNPYHNLSSMKMDMGMDDEAIRILERALRWTAGNPDLFLNLGALYMRKRAFNKAIDAFKRGLSLNPYDARIHFNLGIIYTNTEKLDLAERAYREAINLRPDFCRARNNLGTLLVLLGRPLEAEREYREAIKLDPRCLQALNNLAALVRAKGELKEAETLWKMSLSRNPHQPGIMELIKEVRKEIYLLRTKGK